MPKREDYYKTIVLFTIIKNVDHRIETQFTKYIYRKPIRVFLRQFRNTDFALSKAPGFKYVRWMHLLQLVNILLMMVFIAHNFFTPYILDKIGFPVEEFLKALDSRSGLLITANLFGLTRESLTTILLQSHAIELCQLAVIVLGISKEKRRPIKNGEPDNHNTLETLFYGMLLMTPIYSILFTRNVLTNSVALTRAFEIFITISVVIQLCIIAINMPYAIHDVYWYYKRNRLSSSELFIQLIRPSTVFLFLSLAALCFVYLIPNLLLTAIGIVFAFLFIVVIVISTVSLLLFSIKLYFLNHIFIPQSIEIEELVQNLEKLQFNDLKILYLNRLLDNHTLLEGNWPESLTGKDGHRKKFDNNEIEVAISQLEYNSILVNMRPNDSRN